MLLFKLVKPVLTAAVFAGFVVARKQRNRLRTELTETKDQLKETQVKATVYAERAQHAEDMLKRSLDKGVVSNTEVDFIPDLDVGD